MCSDSCTQTIKRRIQGGWKGDITFCQFYCLYSDTQMYRCANKTTEKEDKQECKQHLMENIFQQCFIQKQTHSTCVLDLNSFIIHDCLSVCRVVRGWGWGWVLGVGGWAGANPS